LNAVLSNVTILGHRHYFFWVQNTFSYDSFNDTMSFVDDTWNFTTGSSEMFSSSLASWSPNGGNYSGTWVAYSPYIYCPPPFTVTAYVNSSVNSVGDQVLWYNYTVLTRGHFYADGSYDYLEFKSQVPGHPKTIVPALFEASATKSAQVNEGYELDAFIGADDGSNNLILSANATIQVKYCSLSPSDDCTPTDFAYSDVPAAVNYGSQTGEQTVGVAISYIGTTAYLSGGPLIANGLWGYSAQAGVSAGITKVINAISVSGSPLALTAQPYVFVFFENAAIPSEGFGWAPDVPAWYLTPGTYDYEIMLADYAEQSGSITVGSSTVTLTATLPYSPSSGVYTPLWAFNNAEVAGISLSGTGTISDQYVLFNNPTSSCTACGSAPDDNLSTIFFSPNDFNFQSFPGLFLSWTNDYIDVNNTPTFCASASGNTFFYLNIQFFETSHVTLSHAQQIRGWPELAEISFYVNVPASQNPDPPADVYVWNSTDDLIMSNNFVATAPESGYVSPDQLVLYGGSNNVVWGNTFRDPPNVKLGASYAGIGEDEGGDLIYNNNFSIDNPVVYLPYNYPNVADCLPQSLGGCANNETGNGWYYNLFSNTWNITPQSASKVVETVNGFPLSGNVLGSFYPTQGGNYYWNYGKSPNNYTTNPYVSRFLYTDWSLIYPLGCGSIQAQGAPCGSQPAKVASYQNGMHLGGDYAPLLLALNLQEVGLVSGTNWTASLNGQNISTTASSITWASLETGKYNYTIGKVLGYTASPSSGQITLNGPVSTPIRITFTPESSTVSINAFAAAPSSVAVGSWTNLTVNASGGIGNLSYAYAHLPPGCTSANTAKLACRPTSAGSFNVSVKVSDQAQNNATRTTLVTVTGVPGGLMINSFTANPADTEFGSWTNLTVNASGGVGALAYSYAGLPSGCTTANTSKLACRPISEGYFNVTATVTDQAHNSVSKATPLMVSGPSGGPTITSFTASPASVTAGSNTTLAVVAIGGVGTLTYTYTGLPPGCTTQNAASLVCTPDSVGTYIVRVWVNDSMGHSTTSATQLTVTGGTGPGQSNILGIPLLYACILFGVIAAVVVIAVVVAVGMRGKKVSPVTTQGETRNGATGPPDSQPPSIDAGETSPVSETGLPPPINPG
jgi:thermopsin